MASVSAPATPLPAQHAVPAIVRIEPPRGWLDLRLGEVWAYRELLYFFVWRDVKVRYKQTAIGVAWVVLQPLLTMGVFTLFFGGWPSCRPTVCLTRFFIFPRSYRGATLRRRCSPARRWWSRTSA